jgi:branched-chain amino acid transport system substrate-binding protein
MKRLTAALFLLAATSALAQEPRLAVIGPMTGTFAEFGAEMRAGVERAAADLGVFAGPVEIADDRCDTDAARAEANRLVGRGVAFVVGHVCFQAALAAAPVYAEAGIVLISPAVQNARLTAERAGPTIFRLGATDASAGTLAGRWLAERFAGGRVAILSDGSGYAAALTSEAGAAFRAGGGEPVYADDFQPGVPDYALLAGRLGLETIDAALVAGAPADVGRIAAALGEIDSAPVVLTGEAGFSRSLIEAAGPAAAILRVVAPIDARSDPAAASVVAAFRAAGTEPDGLVLPSYAAVEALAAAMAEDGDDVAAALAGGTFETVVGPVSFADNGDLEQPAYAVYRVEEGAFVPDR